MPASGASPAPTGTALPAPPKLSADAATQFNARTIARHDPGFVEILDQTNHARLYRLGPDNEYVAQDEQGSLFLIRRSKEPEYALYLINRQGVKNVFLGLYPGWIKLTDLGNNILAVNRRLPDMSYERPALWFHAGHEELKRFQDRIYAIVGDFIPRAQIIAGGNLNDSQSKSAAAPAVQPPAQTQAQQPPAGQDGLAQLFAGLSTVPASNTAHPSHSRSHSTAVQPPVYPHYPQPPPQNPHHYTTNVAPFVGPQAPDSHYSNSPAPGHSDTATPQPQAPAPASSSTAFGRGETADSLLKGIMAAGVPTNPSYPQPPFNAAPTTSVPPPAPLGGSPDRGPPGMAPLPPGHNGVTQRGFPGHTNGHTSPPLNQQQPPPYAPQHHPPLLPPNPDMRDVLVSTFAPNNMEGQPMPVPKEQLVGTLIHLLQTNPSFGEDVWRAYMARCSGGRGGPRQ